MSLGMILLSAKPKYARVEDLFFAIPLSTSTLKKIAHQIFLVSDYLVNAAIKFS